MHPSADAIGRRLRDDPQQVESKDGRVMSSRWLRVYLVVAVVAVLGSLAVPDGGPAQTGWQIVSGWIGAAGIIIGIRRNRPAVSAPWWLFAIAVAGNSTGILIEAI